MRHFAEIEALAASHKGGEAAMLALLPTVPDQAGVTALGDDRWLANFARCIFNSGFNWKVIEKKWPGFEVAFHGFNPNFLAMLPDEEYERLLKDTRIVRHGTKIMSVRNNAIWMVGLAREHGSAANFLGAWPASDQVGLLDLMKKQGSRLGGNTGQYALRFIGKDGFILSRDVTAVLVREGVIAKPASSKKDMAAVQAAFNQWHEETGRPYTHLSRILAMSVG
jgi:3-methyladenine DNA glycosylase Tag